MPSVRASLALAPAVVAAAVAAVAAIPAAVADTDNREACNRHSHRNSAAVAVVAAPIDSIPSSPSPLQHSVGLPALASAVC